MWGGFVYTGEAGSDRGEREFSLKIAVIDLAFGRESVIQARVTILISASQMD
jgi:hypothetical protein